MSRANERSVRWRSAAARRLQALAGTGSVDAAIPAIIRTLLAGVSSPPTDLVTLCGRLKVDRIDDDPDLPAIGELRREGDAYRIVCAAGQSTVRRRFTIAHELAHAILESTGPRAPRAGSEVEKLCDRLAAEILMPGDVFRAAVEGRPTTAATIRALAEQFQTSLSATAIRFAEVRAVSVVEVQNGRVRWSRGQARPNRHQVDELLGQAFDGKPGDGLLFIGALGRMKTYTSEWVRLSEERSGLLLLAPQPPSTA